MWTSAKWRGDIGEFFYKKKKMNEWCAPYKVHNPRVASNPRRGSLPRGWRVGGGAAIYIKLILSPSATWGLKRRGRHAGGVNLHAFPVFGEECRRCCRRAQKWGRINHPSLLLLECYLRHGLLGPPRAYEEISVQGKAPQRLNAGPYCQ